MLSKLILGMSLLGAEWVLYFLIALSVISIALIIEKTLFLRGASSGLDDFRAALRKALDGGRADEAVALAKRRGDATQDLETGLALVLLSNQGAQASVLNELAQDAVLRGRLKWESRLAILATIGNNALFVGLFGTVLGIMKAFHDLSQQAGAAAQTVTAGISEALVATTVGLFVAIPAAVAYNLFQRRVRIALTEAEALKSYLIGKLAK